MSCWVSCPARSFASWVSPVRSRRGSAAIGNCYFFFFAFLIRTYLVAVSSAPLAISIVTVTA